jgi:cytochrome c peroxidase
MLGTTRAAGRLACPRWARFALSTFAICALGFDVGGTNPACAQGRVKPDQTPSVSGRIRPPSATPLGATPLIIEVQQADAWWNRIGSLKDVKPVLPDTSEFIADELAARQLGKALFWDTQVGQDGVACASCHFHAGADLRIQNQVNPGTNADDPAFSPRSPAAQATGLTGKTGPNTELAASDFPLRQLVDPGDRESVALFDSNDIVGSQGAFQSAFAVSTQSLERAKDGRNSRRDGRRSDDEDAETENATDNCKLNRDLFHHIGFKGASTPFRSGQLRYRVSEPRHTPTTVNAAFNRRQFWDGRANSVFNGIDPYGPRSYAREVRPTPLNTGRSDADDDLFLSRIGNPFAVGSGILVLSTLSGTVTLEQPLIENSSLASQAVAINTNGNGGLRIDGRCADSSFADLGRRLLDSKPLSTQVTHPNDSLFGHPHTRELVNTVNLPGLNTTYAALIRKSFKREYWAAEGQYRVDGRTGQIRRTNSTSDDQLGYTQMEHNFSLFWGLAIQAYEQLLISDDSPFDQGTKVLSPAAVSGLEIFVGAGQCISCHSGPLLTNAAVTKAQDDTTAGKRIDSALLGDGYTALLDQGFYNTGVRPTLEDRGLGGRDPYGFDLSFSRQYKWRLLSQPSRAPDIFEVSPCSLVILVFVECQTASRIVPQAIASFPAPANLPRDAVDGAFKVPTLRNVGLTAPYFHNGGQATLKDVVRFYNRGGDRRGPLDDDTTGLPRPTPFGTLQKTNLAPGIGINAKTFGNNGLGLSESNMDDLVQFLLSLTDERVACHAGVFDHPELPLVIGQRGVSRSGTNRAKDIVATLPAVGQAGLQNCFPNTGDLFGTANATDRRKLQDIVTQKLR